MVGVRKDGPRQSGSKAPSEEPSARRPSEPGATQPPERRWISSNPKGLLPGCQPEQSAATDLIAPG
jgi:hypothetical protein